MCFRYFQLDFRPILISQGGKKASFSVSGDESINLGQQQRYPTLFIFKQASSPSRPLRCQLSLCSVSRYKRLQLPLSFTPSQTWADVGNHGPGFPLDDANMR